MRSSMPSFGFVPGLGCGRQSRFSTLTAVLERGQLHAKSPFELQGRQLLSYFGIHQDVRFVCCPDFLVFGEPKR